MSFRLLIRSWIFASVFPFVAAAQNPLVGAWERISWVAADGSVLQPPAFPSFTIFTADGFWSQMILPPNRPKVDKPLEQMTKDELVARFARTEARFGTYMLSGNRLTRFQTANSDPNREGVPSVSNFRMDGDILVLLNPQSKDESRFRRAKKSN